MQGIQATTNLKKVLLIWLFLLVFYCYSMEFVAGPTLNIYNTRALERLAGLGLQRWVMPVEHSRQILAEFRERMTTGIEVESFAWGRLPLAFSARCYTARNHDLPKDDCGYRCLDDPDGMLLKTREADPFLVLNGIQTQSARTLCLVRELDSADVDIFRISPQASHTSRVIQLFHDCLAGERDGAEVADELETLMPIGPCDGYWHGEAGMLAHCNA